MKILMRQNHFSSQKELNIILESTIADLKEELLKILKKKKISKKI